MSKKKIAIGLLSLATAATWAPVLLEEERVPRHVDEDDEDDYGDELVASATLPTPAPRASLRSTAPEVEAPLPPADGPDEAPVATAAGEADVVRSSRTLLQELRTLVPGARRGGLDQLATAWGPAASADAIPREPAPLPVTLASTLEEEDHEIDEFLAANPLSGILWSQDAPLALLGAHVVRPGQELLPGLSLVAIEPRSIVLAHEGRDVRLVLPPIRSRRPAPPEEEAAEEEDDEPSEEPTFESAGPSEEEGDE